MVVHNETSTGATSRIADIRKAMTEAKDHGKHDVLMRVKTAKATLFVAVPFSKA